MYKELFKTWFGKYNIYGLFIEKSLRLLNKNGILCFIIPATWMILDEFKLLRKLLAETGRVEVYYLGGGVFKNLNVVTTILIIRKGLRGLELYDFTSNRNPKLNVVKDYYYGEIITFETELTKIIESSSNAKLGDLFDIKISPRSPEIKSCKFLLRRKEDEALPLLNGKNLMRGYILYGKCFTGYYISPQDVPKLREWFTKDRVVIGHTKGGKLVSAIDYKHYAWTGDAYHLIPKPDVKVNLKEIVEILNSKIINKYMHDKYREITPHTTKTQLKQLPLISLDKIREIKRIFYVNTV